MKINTSEFELLRRYIEIQCGITVAPEKQYLIETRLTRLVVETGSNSFGEFYQHVERAGNGPLRDKIIDAMTTNETLWFRDSSPYTALREKILREFSAENRGNPGAKMRIWSAASSTGQEPYSMAMVVDDYCRSPFSNQLRPEQVEIIATDISPSALFVAMAGRYDRISMRRGFVDDWAPYKDRYFTEDGRVSVIDDRIKGRVKYSRFNLQNSFAGMGKFHVIFLRNVAIYFSTEFKRALFEKLYQSLHPNGYLILGTAETTSGYTQRFTSENHGKAVLFRPRG
ncbi:MAG: protein-glutamate O-methyltransferase CheR [Deltaproteobacteria bacterium]|nr:protein-glutamate O-methyltransferase CheR [Deltaproteobacteria bacterium]